MPIRLITRLKLLLLDESLAADVSIVELGDSKAPSGR